ncbi:MAG: hypothetical protein KGN84_05705, partial [Acidobacteriota bacterium]|nr:hypothetical protein [Acidobacteriota bacterium]
MARITARETPHPVPLRIEAAPAPAIAPTPTRTAELPAPRKLPPLVHTGGFGDVRASAAGTGTPSAVIASSVGAFDRPGSGTGGGGEGRGDGGSAGQRGVTMGGFGDVQAVTARPSEVRREPSAPSETSVQITYKPKPV